MLKNKAIRGWVKKCTIPPNNTLFDIIHVKKKLLVSSLGMPSRKPPLALHIVLHQIQ
jgi:hypothetical protein